MTEEELLISQSSETNNDKTKNKSIKKYSYLFSKILLIILFFCISYIIAYVFSEYATQLLFNAFVISLFFIFRKIKK